MKKKLFTIAFVLGMSTAAMAKDVPAPHSFEASGFVYIFGGGMVHDIWEFIKTTPRI